MRIKRLFSNVVERCMKGSLTQKWWSSSEQTRISEKRLRHTVVGVLLVYHMGDDELRLFEGKRPFSWTRGRIVFRWTELFRWNFSLDWICYGLRSRQRIQQWQMLSRDSKQVYSSNSTIAAGSYIASGFFLPRIRGTMGTVEWTHEPV